MKTALKVKQNLVIGLGNPGEKYKNTRHNVGFLVIDELKKRENKNVAYLKSKNFMNNSGDFVKKQLAVYGLQFADLYVIHDDLDIPLGFFKIQLGKGPKDHNGIKDVEGKLGTKDFWRVRVGIESRQQTLDTRIKGEQYVLEIFTKKETGQVEQVVKKIVKDLCKRLEV